MRSTKAKRNRVSTRSHTLLRRTKTEDGVALVEVPEDIARQDIPPITSDEFTLQVQIDNKIPLKQNPRYINHNILALEESDAVRNNVDALRYLTELKNALKEEEENISESSPSSHPSSPEPSKTE